MTAVSNAQPRAKTVNFSDFHERIESILKLDKVSPKDLDGLTELQYEYLSERCTSKLLDLEGEALADFMQKMGPFLLRDMNESVWEYNHNAITKAISKMICEEGCMPSRNKIARETGLSRTTIVRHLESYDKDPDYLGR